MKKHKNGLSYSALIAQGRIATAAKSQHTNGVIIEETIGTNCKLEPVVDTAISGDTQTDNSSEENIAEEGLLLDCPPEIEMTVAEKMDYILKSIPAEAWPLRLSYARTG